MNGNVISHSHGTGDACLQVLWSVQASKDIFNNLESVESEQIGTFIRNISSIARKVKRTVQAVNCGIAGKLKPINMVNDSAMGDSLKSALKKDNVNISGLGRVSKAVRVILGENVYFGKGYTRMQKRVVHFSLIDDGDGGVCVGEVQYFLYHHASGLCYAVYKKLVFSDTDFLLHPQVKHVLKVKEIENQLKLVRADQLTEKVLYMHGCICRLPNLYGLCG